MNTRAYASCTKRQRRASRNSAVCPALSEVALNGFRSNTQSQSDLLNRLMDSVFRWPLALVVQFVFGFEPLF